ncbi:GTP cyclohydrolase II [Roseicyclus persicicus]|uniref:GTP cyclohydrolase-2 n=1 Tax=Roseicyclus persicicus TaxID=2650661 RepID=A0A7X6GX51_9RHOB|nr:GTP cyclohydrolase II [Roseibacterium persicicum]NKX44015.1 GTP cyclohydrolase II [Roseibacterium persicicum]
MLTSPLAASGSAIAVPDRPDQHVVTPALAPRGIERLHRIRGDLRLGLPVILQDGGDSVLVALVETVTDARYGAMTALGQPELVLTRRRAEALGALPPIQGDTLRLRVPAGADLAWLAAVAGQAGPDAPTGGASLPILQAGTALHRAAIEIAKTVQVVPAVLAVPLAGRDGGAVAALGLTAMALAEITGALDEARSQTRVSSARLPMDASAAGRVHVFRPDDGGAEHYAIEIGTPDLSGPVTVRLHSACFTGDVLGSLKCDCGPQLRGAMAAMAAGPGGVLLYLNQEGRGIGLANKMRAYALQDAGLDTVEANHWLGFEDDQRDFRIGAQILRRMGIGQVRLMTNNPAKVASLGAQGIEVVERVPLRVGRTAQNAHYLATKAAKSGHLL